MWHSMNALTLLAYLPHTCLIDQRRQSMGIASIAPKTRIISNWLIKKHSCQLLVA